MSPKWQAARERSVRICRSIGLYALVAARTLRSLPGMNRRELYRALANFGFSSIPLAFILALLTGLMVIIQTNLYVQHFGARSFVGWGAGYAAVCEFGPLILGLVMAGRVGCRNAAELASLQVGGQLDGLRGISLDPYPVLIAPRATAIVASMGCLAALVFATSVGCEAITAYFVNAIPLRTFLDGFAESLTVPDVLGGWTKCVAFAAAIALVSTVAGISAFGGAKAVGRAAASSMVASSIAVFGLDFVLSSLLSRLIR